MSEIPFETRMAITHNAVQGAKFNADAAKEASEDGDDVGVFCITPRKGIFHIETVESYCGFG